MLLRCIKLADGPGPSEAIVSVNTQDGLEEVIIDRDILKNGTIDVGFLIAQRDGLILLELPRESVSGRTRVWVSKENIVEQTVAA